MAKKIDKTKKKRRRLRLKKSARRTIAALLMVTAIIVAAVPVRDVVAESTDLTIESIVTSNGFCNTTNFPDMKTSERLITKQYAFPYLSGSEGSTIDLTDYDSPSSKFPLYKIDTTGMTRDVPVPIFGISEPNSGQASVTEYLPKNNGSNAYNPENGVTLGSDVLYTSLSNDAFYFNKTERPGYMCMYHLHLVSVNYTSGELSMDSNDPDGNTEEYENDIDTDESYSSEENNVSAIEGNHSESTDDNILSETISVPGNNVIEDSNANPQNLGINGNTETNVENENLTPEDNVVNGSVENTVNSGDDAEEHTQSIDSSEGTGDVDDNVVDSDTISQDLSDAGNSVYYDDGYKVDVVEKRNKEYASHQVIELTGGVLTDNQRCIKLDRYVFSLESGELTKDQYKQKAGSADEHEVLGYYCDKVCSVDSIAAHAFEKCTNFTKITIPDNILSIGDYAFNGCLIEDIKVGNQCKAIGVMAFANNGNLKTADLSGAGALNYIGDGAFANTNLTGIEIPVPVRIIGSGCFFGCTNLKNPSSSSSTTSDSDIEDAYDQANGDFFPKLTSEFEIGHYLFARSGLDRINLYNKRIENTGLGKSGRPIGLIENSKGMFNGCSDLKHVIYPSTFSGSVSNDTFGICPNLKYIKFFTENATVDNTGNNYEFVTSDNLKISGKSETTVSDSFYIWGIDKTAEAFEYAKKNHNLYRYTSEPNNTNNKNYIYDINGYTFDLDVTDQMINGVQRIGSDAKAELLLPSITIGGKQMSSIGSDFSESLKKAQTESGLKYPTSIVIPENYKTIENGAFQGIDSVKTLEITTNGVSLGKAAFQDCNSLETVMFHRGEGEEGSSTIGDDCFRDCEKLTYISFRDFDMSNAGEDVVVGTQDVPVSSVGTGAFYTNNTTPLDSTSVGMEYVDTNEKVYLIIRGYVPVGTEADYAPYRAALCLDGGDNIINDTKAYATYVSGSPENVACQYFKNTDGTGYVSLLSYPTLDTKVEDGEGTFKTIRELAAKWDDLSMNQKETVSYPTRSSSDQSGSTNGGGIIVPGGVDSINRSKHGVTLYMQEINDSAKTGLGLKHINFYSVSSLPTNYAVDGTIDLDNAYHGISNNTELESVTFYSDVKDLGSLPFLNDENLTEVTFNEDAPSLGNPQYICKYGIIYSTTDGTNYRLVEVLPGRSGAIPNDNNADENSDYIAKVTSIDPGAFKNCNKVNSVSLENASGLKNIPYQCFEGCDNLLDVILPESIENIDKEAFSNIGTSKFNLTNYSEQCNYEEDAFYGTSDVWLYGYTGSSTEAYFNKMQPKGSAKLSENHMDDIHFRPVGTHAVQFIDFDNTPLGAPVIIEHGKMLTELPDEAAAAMASGHRSGYSFARWYNLIDLEEFVVGQKSIYHDMTVQAQYTQNGTCFASFIDERGNDLGEMTFNSPDVINGSKISSIITKARQYGTVIRWEKYYPEEESPYIYYGEQLIYEIPEGETRLKFKAYYTGATWPTGTPTPTLSPTATPSGTPTVIPATPTPGPTLGPDDYVNVTFFDLLGMNIVKKYVKGTQIRTDNIPTEVTMIVSSRKNRTFTGWNVGALPYPADGLTEDISLCALYDKKSSSSSSSSSNGGSTGGGGGSSTGTSSSNRSSSSSSSSSSRSSSMGTSSSNINSSTTPVVVSGAVSGYIPQGNIGNAGTISSGSGNTGGGSQRGSGNTSVISTTPGISDVGKMSATVNGSSDSYVLKITETDEANQMAVQALTNEYGSLDNIRYLPIDISLYDSTGQNKISPIPENTSVSVTMPIPDDLAIYGGNAKAAGTAGGVLDKLNPRFTVINNVPCMNFTCTHLSPYVIYVDTANLSDPAVRDTTPQTGDMIHPKWFLAIGLMAAGIFLFLKKDRGERVAAA